MEKREKEREEREESEKRDVLVIVRLRQGRSLFGWTFNARPLY